MTSTRFLARAYRLYVQVDWAARRSMRALSPFLVRIDYTRFREFAFAFEHLSGHLRAGARILDVGSPKLFALALARSVRDVGLTSLDILDHEVRWLAEASKHVRLSNLRGLRADVRRLPFPDDTFDFVVSISALEHVAPAESGDREAIGELARVVRTGGRIVLTLPYAREAFTEHRAGDVYERKSEGSAPTFFQRFYDERRIRSVLESGGLVLETFLVIQERFMGDDPHRRWSGFLSGGTWRRRLLAPWYPLLGHVLLSRPRGPCEGGGRPYIACLVLKKTGS